MLHSSEGARQSLLMGGGYMLAAGLSAVSMILVSRVLGPEQFGLFSVSFSLALILAKVVDMGYTNSQQRYLPQTTNTSKRSRIISYVFQVKLAMMLVVAVVGLFAYQPLARLLSFPEPSLLLVAFLVVGATALFDQLAALYQSLHRFGAAVTLNLVQSGTKLIGMAGLYLAGVSNVLVYVLVYLAAPLTTLLPAWWYKPKWLTLRLAAKYHQERDTMKQLALHAMVSSLSLGLIDNIDVLVVQGLLSEYQTGLLSGASRIAMILMVVAYSLSMVLNNRVSRYTNPLVMKTYLKKAMLLLVACLVGCLLLVFFSAPMIRYTIGAAYLPAVDTLSIMMVAGMVTIGTIPLMAVFFAVEGYEWFFSFSGMLQLGVMLFGLLVLTPIHGIEGAAAARLIMRVVMLLLTGVVALLAVRKLSKTV